MGSGISRCEIVLDQDEGQHELLPLPAGSLLKGKVIVELSKPLVRRRPPATRANNTTANEKPPPPQQPAALELRLYAKEKVCMNRRKATKTQGTAGTRAAASKRAERILLDLRLQWPKYPLEKEQQEDGSSRVPAGTYVFPFRLQLPLSLPSSTYYPMKRARSKMRFRIQYKLVAALDGGKRQATTKYLRVKAAAPDPPPAVTPCLLQPVSQTVEEPGFFVNGQGTFLFGAAVENCNLHADEFVHLHVACRNDSNALIIRRVQIQILERFEWGTEATTHIDETTGAVTTSATLHQKGALALVTLPDVQLPGLAKEKETKSVLKSVVDSIFGSNPSQQQRLYQAVYQDLVSGENLIRIQIPSAVRESYGGQLVQVKHAVRIEFQTSSGLARTFPAVEIPLHVTGTAVPIVSSEDGAVTGSGAGIAYHVPTETAVTGLGTATTTFGDGDVAAAPTFESERSGGVNGGGGKKKNSEVEIPVVAAVAIPDDAVQASTLITADAVVLGVGDALLRQESGRRQLTDLVPVTPPLSSLFSTLLDEMRSSINDYELISQKLLDPQWVELFRSLSPTEFGSVISCVNVAFDQPRVALLLAPHLHQGSGIQCADAAAAIRMASATQHRAVMAQRLLPLCSDAEQNSNLVRAELNDWEQTVAHQVLEAAASG